MTGLLHAHSGLRYIVLALAIVIVVTFVLGTIRGRSFSKSSAILLRTLVVVVDIQVLLGVAMYIGGARPDGVLRHLALMVIALVVLHVTSSARKRKPAEAGYRGALVGVVAALALIVLGILSIGRPIF